MSVIISTKHLLVILKFVFCSSMCSFCAYWEPKKPKSKARGEKDNCKLNIANWEFEWRKLCWTLKLCYVCDLWVFVPGVGYLSPSNRNFYWQHKYKSHIRVVKIFGIYSSEKLQFILLSSFLDLILLLSRIVINPLMRVIDGFFSILLVGWFQSLLWFENFFFYSLYYLTSVKEFLYVLESQFDFYTNN